LASTNDVIFPESMADFLANPVDIRFGSMPVKSTAPAACLVIEGNAVTTGQQIETDLSSESHPPTPSDLIAGINRVEDMLSNTIKVCECIKHHHRTSSPSSMPLGLRNTAHVASRYMNHKIQIESGPKTQDHGSRRSHLDKPCTIHENPKHTARQCRVLKKLCRPLTAAHHLHLNRETSPDRLTFQIARTTISPNYPGEELETLDREILVVSADVPLQDLQMNNAKSVRMLMLPELSDDSKRSPLLPQVQVNSQVNNCSSLDRSTLTPGNKQLHQLPLSSDATMTHLVPTEYAQETSSGISSVTDSKFKTLHKPTWELLLPL
jgi:hypothetical protein